MVAISASVYFSLHHSEADEDGRYILSVTIDNHPLTIVNVYAPNTAQRKFYATLLSKLAPRRSAPLIMCGDFNYIIDPALNTSNPSKWKPSALSALLKREDLYDPWMCLHDSERDYTFYSPPH